MTPCEKLGYKVGDKFEVLNTDDGFEVGHIVELIEDDDSYCPLFKSTTTNAGRYLNVIVEEGSKSRVDVKPLKQCAVKPISKSKHQLAQQLIEAGVTQFPEGANWAAQDKSCDTAFFIGKPRRSSDGQSWLENLDTKCGQRTFDISNAEVYLPTLIPNWHQTVLSRDEFDQIVAEAVVQDEPARVRPTDKQLGRLDSIKASITSKLIDSVDTADTLDQLLQDWRNADDYAQRKQTEADEAAAMRDERWQAVQARAGEMGVTVGRCEPVVVVEPEWVGACERCVVVNSPDDSGWEGRECTLIRIDKTDERLPYRVQDEEGDTYWVRSIRRP